MELKYSERLKNNLKNLINNKYLFKLFLALILSLSILGTFVFSNYIKTTENSSNETLVEINKDDNGKETKPAPDAEIKENEEEDTINTPNNSSKRANTPSSIEESKDVDTSNIQQEEQIPPDEPIPDPEPIPSPPESPSAVVAFYADTQSDTDQEDLNHQKVVNYILSSGANPVFHAGDVMEDGTQASLDRFNSVTATLRSTRIFYAALGNNDRQVGDSSTPSQLFLDNFVFPNNERWYSVNYGNLHLIVLDSAFARGSSAQLNWLISDLQSSNSQSRITGVMYHHPTFASTISSHLINYGVDFVVAGHVHSYSHSTSNGINYFTLSGQPSIGYIVARIYSTYASITAYNSNNAIIESIQFNNR
jgi:predicted phosphodiesterase